MRLIFNPLSGFFEFVNVGNITNDFLSGYYSIQVGENVTIPIYKQSITVGTLTNGGSLTIDGQLIVL